MNTTLITWIITVLAVERITEIIINGAIFERPRHWILSKNNFFSELFGCGYCMSVWVSAIFAWALPGQFFNNQYLDIGVKIFAVHGLSNVLHELFKRWFDKIPILLCLQRVEPTKQESYQPEVYNESNHTQS